MIHAHAFYFSDNGKAEYPPSHIFIS